MTRSSVGPNMGFLVTIIGCILFMQESNAEGKLKKPELEVNTSDFSDVIMIGDTVHFYCTNLTKAQEFCLIKNGITVTKQNSSKFIVNNISKNDSGFYCCSYSVNSEQAQQSDAVYVYVKDVYPPPTLTVEPRRNVQPGEEIRITCHTHYSDMIFTIYKDGKMLEESAGNQFPYVIRKAEEKDEGQYTCRFRSKHNSMVSDWTNPVMIHIKEVPSPSISWEVNADEETVKIICTAPVSNKKMWFQLLNSSKEIEDEIGDINQSIVKFNISDSNHTPKKYYCMYRIKIYNNFAHSVISNPIIIWGDNDCTIVNIVRLLLSALVLIVLGVILVKHFNMFQEEKEYPLELPTFRKTHAVHSEYSEIVIMKTDNVPADTLEADTLEADTLEAASSSCEISSDNAKKEEE